MATIFLRPSPRRLTTAVWLGWTAPPIAVFAAGEAARQKGEINRGELAAE